MYFSFIVSNSTEEAEAEEEEEVSSNSTSTSGGRSRTNDSVERRESDSDSVSNEFEIDEEDYFWDSGIRVEDVEEEIIVPKVKIIDMNSRGKVNILFNTEMNFPPDFATRVNSSKRKLRRGST